MSRFLWLLLPCLILLVSCHSKRSADELVVGMDLSYPPFETINAENRPTGVSVDLAEALAKSLGKKLRIENITFLGLIPSLQNGRIDCIISSMTDTEERRGSIAFSEPYLTIGLAMLTGRESGIETLDDVNQKGKTVVVRQGTTGELWAREHLKNATVLALEKENAAVLEVIQGRASAFIYDQMSVWLNARKHPETTRAVLTPLKKEAWAVGVRKDDPELLAQINRFLEEYRKEGGFEKLGDTYLRDQKEAFEREGIPFYF